MSDFDHISSIEPSTATKLTTSSEDREPRKSSAASQVALISQAASRQGLWLTAKLLDAGWRVCALVPNEHDLEKIEASFAGAERSRLHLVDSCLSTREKCVETVNACRARFGRIDALISHLACDDLPDTAKSHRCVSHASAGDASREGRLLPDVDSTLGLAEAIKPYFDAQKTGRIVLIIASSSTFKNGHSRMETEEAEAIWATLSKEMQPVGVTVNMVAPRLASENGLPLFLRENTILKGIDDVLSGRPASWRAGSFPDEAETADAAAFSVMPSQEAWWPPLRWLLSNDAEHVTGRVVSVKSWRKGLSGLQAARKASRGFRDPSQAAAFDSTATQNCELVLPSAIGGTAALRLIRMINGEAPD